MSAIAETEVDPSTGADSIGEFTKLKAQVKQSWTARSKWRKEAQRAYDFKANHQWSEEDLAILAEQNRPAVSFNRCAPIIQATCGLEINNRQDVAYLPRQVGQSEIDEAITNVVKWVRDECNAPDEESDSFEDLVTCGEGWQETRMSYDEDPKGQIVQERIYPLEMGANKGAKRANYKDARLLYRIRDMDAEDAAALLDGEFLPEVLHAAWITDDITPADGGEGNKKDYPDKTREGVDKATGRRTIGRGVQAPWWVAVVVAMVGQDGATDVQEMSADDFVKYQERATLLGTQFTHAKTKKRMYYEGVLGESLLGKRPLATGKFQWEAMTGRYDERDKCFFGMMRDLFDPQMWANKWLAQTMNILNTNAKGGIIAESDAFVNQRKAEKDWADPTKMIVVKPGSLGKNKIKDRTPPPMPQGLNDLVQFAMSSMRDVSGVNLEMLGAADREQAASLEQQRRQSAMTILAKMFNSLRRYRLRQGKLLLHFVQLLPDNTLVRVLEQGQWKFVPFIKNKEVECYEVIIDEAPSSPDQKQYIWSMTMQLMQQGIQWPMPAILALLKYSPYPEKVVQEITAAMGMGQDGPSPDQLKQKLQQAEAALHVMEQSLQNAQAEAKTAQDKKDVELLRNQVDEYKAQTERMRAEWEHQVSLLEFAGTVAAPVTPSTDGVVDPVTGEAAPGPAPPAPQDQMTEILTLLKQMAPHMTQQNSPEPASDPNQPNLI